MYAMLTAAQGKLEITITPPARLEEVARKPT